MDDYQFTYKALSEDKNEIRLLRIHKQKPSSDQIECDIFHVSLDSTPSYNALSYAWGDPLDPKFQISLSGRAFMVRKNLWEALHQIRFESEELIIWIDAICINQSDLAERSEQVCKMKSIFEQAKQVMVWLGSSERGSDLAFALVNILYEKRHSYQQMIDLCQQQWTQDAILSLRYVFARPYWHRMWIIQELTVAQDIVFYCGSVSVRGDVLVEVQRRFQLKFGDALPIIWHLAPDEPSTRSITSFYGAVGLELFRKALTSSQDMSFMDCLQYHEGQTTSDPRDMIYGLASLVNSKVKYTIQVDYSKSVEQVYTDFAVAEISNTKRLDILTRGRPRSLIKYSVPSWVPDWSTKDLTWKIHVFDHSKLFAASASAQAVVEFSDDHQFLTMEVIQLGSVTDLGDISQLELNDFGNVKSTVNTVTSWLRLFEKRNPTSADFEAFARCITYDRFENRGVSHGGMSRFLQSLLGAYAMFYEQLYPNQNNLNPTLIGYWKAHFAQKEKEAAAPGSDREDLQASETETWITFVQDVALYSSNYRFFLATNGLIGMAPAASMTDDLICIPLGCSIPLILRRAEGDDPPCYFIVGGAYAAGCMYGEALGKLNRGEVVVQKLVVC
jgi:hypothetical protein